LITAARNEEGLIGETIQSVLSQTALPDLWIIVSDGSTDRTDEIVSRYSTGHPWIELLRMPEHKDRNFAAKVHCFNLGYKKIRQRQFDIIGNLDADITFGPDYFEYLLGKFRTDPKLGVAGTPFIEGTGHYDYRFANIGHVSGACQLFRRECFEQIGGYIPIKEGGIDWIAVTTARMKGWITRTYIERECVHHRKIGTGGSGRLSAIFKYGKKNYALGGHPVWQISRALFQITKKPYILGGMLLFSGYAWGFLTRMKRPLSPELLAFYRREQMTRLRKIVANVLILPKKAGIR
jgi:glycosyltransferase involved in cell wall biosynthesis